MSTIPLAKPYTPGKLSFPVYVSYKLDGVPIRIDIIPHLNGWVDEMDGRFMQPFVKSRQGKPVPSVRELVNTLWSTLDHAGMIPEDGLTLIGEVTHKTLTSFKDVSGVVRRQEPQDDLVLNLFEAYAENDYGEGGMFYERAEWLDLLAPHLPADVRVCTQEAVEDAVELEIKVADMLHARPDAEDLVLRNHDDPFEPGKRSWGYQRFFQEPTEDVLIVGVEEAVSKEGKRLGMAGGLIGEWQGERIGIGPGKLTHEERKKMFYAFGYGAAPRMAQVKHKGDQSYSALRQPTFQHWRDDKQPA